MRNVPSLETIRHDYDPKGVRFYYVYKSLAHPEHDGYVTPFTLKERLMHVKEAERRLGSRFTWICDTMSNDLKHALGDAPNSEFVIDPGGKIVRKRAWSRPAELRKDLEELVGEIEKPTKVADLNLKTSPPPKGATTGVVPRIKVPDGMRPLRIEPEIKEGGQPFYVKLRAEADRDLLHAGKGSLYLGFHLDPIYHVHWNNLSDPIQYELTAPQGMTVSPASSEGPKVKEASDRDPREFLVKIDAAGSKKPISLTVRYFACNDAETWCKAVTQTYTIRLEPDTDGGRVIRKGRRPGGGSFARRGRGNFTMGRIVKVDLKARALIVMTFDRQRREFHVPEGTPIFRDRRRSKLEDLKERERVRVGLQPVKDGKSKQPVVRRVMVRSGGPPPRRRTR